MSTIQEVRANAHKILDQYFDVKETAQESYAPTPKGMEYLKAHAQDKFDPTVIDMAVAAGYLKATFEKEAEAQAAIEKELDTFLSSGRIKQHGGRGNPRPEDEQMTFRNRVLATGKTPKEILVEKLKDVDTTKYKVFDFDESTGKLKGSVFNTKDAKWVELSYKHPGSMAWKIKQHISGDSKEADVIIAS